MMPAKWYLERAAEQIEEGKEHRLWAEYHKTFGNQLKYETENGKAQSCLKAATLFLGDAIKAIEGDKDDQ